MQAYGDYVERVYGVRWPESEIRALRRPDSDGRPSGDGFSARTNAKILLGAKSPDYRAVRAPALAIYAVQDSIEDAYPWLRERQHGIDAVLGAVAVATRRPVAIPSLNAWNWFNGRWRPFVDSQKEKFLAEMPNGTVREIHGPHYIFLSHPDQVASAVRTFLTRGAN